MLPIFRLIPVGGVFLAIAILLLALNPPQATSPSARAGLLPARGALLDRNKHPEWRQFLLLAAWRRASEIERLRSLHDTTVSTEIPATPKAAAPVDAKPEIVEPKVAEAAPVAVEPKTTATAPAEATSEVKESVAVAPATVAAPQPIADEPKVAAVAPVVGVPKAVQPAPAESKHKAVEPNPVAAEPKIAEAAPVVVEPKTADATPVAAAPKAAQPAPVEPKHEAVEPKPVAAEPKIAEAAPVVVEPKTAGTTPVAAAPKAAQPAPAAPRPAVVEPKPVAAEPKIAAVAPIATAPAAPTPAPVAVKPESVAPAPTQVASIATATPPGAKPTLSAAKHGIEAAAPAPRLETNGSRTGTEVAPPATTPAAKAPAEVKVAVVPEQPAQPDDDVTGSIEPATGDATIPIGIGEASSIELQVMLPPERPAILRRLDRARALWRARRIARAKKKTPPPDFFTFLFQSFAVPADTNSAPVKNPTTSYPPNNNWKGGR